MKPYQVLHNSPNCHPLWLSWWSWLILPTHSHLPNVHDQASEPAKKPNGIVQDCRRVTQCISNEVTAVLYWAIEIIMRGMSTELPIVRGWKKKKRKEKIDTISWSKLQIFKKHSCQQFWGLVQYEDSVLPLASIRPPIIQIRWSHSHLISIMEIFIHAKMVFILEPYPSRLFFFHSSPCYHCKGTWVLFWCLFPRCFATREINTKITLSYIHTCKEWRHKEAELGQQKIAVQHKSWLDMILSLNQSKVTGLL